MKNLKQVRSNSVTLDFGSRKATIATAVRMIQGIEMTIAVTKSDTSLSKALKQERLAALNESLLGFQNCILDAGNESIAA